MVQTRGLRSAKSSERSGPSSALNKSIMNRGTYENATASSGNARSLSRRSLHNPAPPMEYSVEPLGSEANLSGQKSQSITVQDLVQPTTSGAQKTPTPCDDIPSTPRRGSPPKRALVSDSEDEVPLSSRLSRPRWSSQGEAGADYASYRDETPSDSGEEPFCRTRRSPRKSVTDSMRNKRRSPRKRLLPPNPSKNPYLVDLTASDSEDEEPPKVAKHSPTRKVMARTSHDDSSEDEAPLSSRLLHQREGNPLLFLQHLLPRVQTPSDSGDDPLPMRLRRSSRNPIFNLTSRQSNVRHSPRERNHPSRPYNVDLLFSSDSEDDIPLRYRRSLPGRSPAASLKDRAASDGADSEDEAPLSLRLSKAIQSVESVKETPQASVRRTGMIADHHSDDSEFEMPLSSRLSKNSGAARDSSDSDDDRPLSARLVRNVRESSFVKLHIGGHWLRVEQCTKDPLRWKVSEMN